MKRCAAGLLAMVLAAGSGSAPARAAEAHGALDGPRQAVEKADYRISGHLVRVDAAGVRTSYPVTIKAHWFPGVLRVFIDLASPSGTSSATSPPIHVFLELKPGGQNSIRLARKGDAAATTLPVEKWTDGLAGTGFSFEDFFEEQFFWAGQAVSEHVKYGARDCDLVKSTPGATDKAHYAEARTWLDRASNFPVYVEKTLKGNGAVKEYTYFGLRHEGGVWSASQIEEKTRGQAGSSLLIIDRGSAKANLGPADFTPEQITRFP
jgi:hypothetical protein